MDDDEDEDGHEAGKEDPNPLCSDDDVSDDEPAELFDTENVVVCQYDRVRSSIFPLINFNHFLSFRYHERKINGDLI